MQQYTELNTIAERACTRTAITFYKLLVLVTIYLIYMSEYLIYDFPITINIS